MCYLIRIFVYTFVFNAEMIRVIARNFPLIQILRPSNWRSSNNKLFSTWISPSQYLPAWFTSFLRAYAYNPPKSNSKTAQPEIPEPQFRVGPPGVSSGLSFRNLPDASLLAIRQICTHYEKKCSGKVGLMGSSLIFCPAGGLSLLKGNLQPCLTLTPTPPPPRSTLQSPSPAVTFSR